MFFFFFSYFVAVRKRLLLSLGLLVCLFVGLVSFHWLMGQDERLNRENWANIKEGMSQQEVEKLIGKPRSYLTKDAKRRSLAFWEEKQWEEFKDPSWKMSWWDGNNISIGVSFDAKHKAVRSVFCSADLEHEGILYKIRRWLGMPWW